MRKELENVKDLKAYGLTAALGYKVHPKTLPKKGEDIDYRNNTAINKQKKKSKKKRKRSKKKKHKR